ncbi:AAA family ATPase [Knoellia aerolata]|uniref:ATPase n=1 Tax=Knoellia aerolata DSM 18566 TaxID=1385519 RepID=A0A0A0JV20_9MICO|nr:ATP-binding protein [Knoellia aerolata]KGN41275.1 ATPase [Knoellia aerolata DSM 18566]
MTGSSDVAELLTRLRRLEEHLRALVALKRSTDPAPDDPFRGLYLSDDAIDRVLDGEPESLLRLVERLPARETVVSEPGSTSRLEALAATCRLSPLDVDLLLVAVACDLDPRFEQLFGYLNDDVTRRRPSVAVALAVCGVALASVAGRERLSCGPLITCGLVVVEDLDRPFPGRALRVPDRVLAHLLGIDVPDELVAQILRPVPEVDWGDGTELADALAMGTKLVYLREPPTGSGMLVAANALARLGLRSVCVDLEALGRHSDAAAAARCVAREARLTRAGVLAGPVSEKGMSAELLSALSPLPLPVLLVGSCSWDPAWSAAVPLLVDVPKSTLSERGSLWREVLADADVDFDAGDATSQFLMRPTQVARAAEAARLQARIADDRRVTVEHVRAGARGENGSALQRLARRVEPAVGWTDLALPVSTMTALQEVAARARHRERVLGDWAMRPGGGRGFGVAALFAGDSGTGKTMSAEVVAGELGLDLYVVDLATVVDKYVGETEKNLDRIFDAAAGVNGVLLFDEADAVFGKRSEVKDAHDRYANVESAFLLQRMESFDGLAILATNLRANIDEAFTRRLDVIVDFPMPDAGQRLVLWRNCLRPLPQSESLDLEFCSESFELSGGGIRSAAVTAAYLAANADSPVTMAQVVMAVQREYRKLGRLCVEQEFGRYHAMLA